MVIAVRVCEYVCECKWKSFYHAKCKFSFQLMFAMLNCNCVCAYDMLRIHSYNHICKCSRQEIILGACLCRSTCIIFIHRIDIPFEWILNGIGIFFISCIVVQYILELFAANSNAIEAQFVILLRPSSKAISSLFENYYCSNEEPYK